MRLCDVPLDRPVATIMVLVCVMVMGAVALTQLPLGFMPPVAEPEIDINVPFPGSHPLEGLREVVRPIEEEVATIPGVTGSFAWANSGNTGIEVQFDWGTNVDLKKMEVRDAVERARPLLPPGIGHISVEGDTGGPSAEIIGGRISAESDLSESWELLDRRIRRPLERIRGVARVSLYGVDPQQVRIDLDLDALKQHGIAVEQLVQRIDAANVDLDLGTIHGEELRYEVRAKSRFRTVETVEAIDLGRAGLRLGDVADVGLREPLLTRGRHLNRNFAIGFDVFKEPTANTVATVDRVVQRIEEFERDPKLQGIHVLVWQNQGEEILNSLTGLRNAGLFGGTLAVGVLFFFLRRISTTLIVAVAIPFSLVVTCGAMFLLGMEFNVLSMLGLMLGVGMLVDNAVVVIENIYRLHATGLSPRQAAREGARQVTVAVFAATATTVIVWSWLLVIEPNQLKIYIGQVAAVICLSVACSLLISLTFIPLAAAHFIPRRAPKPGLLSRRVLPAYRRLLGWTLDHRAVTLVCLFLLAASAAIPFSQIEKTGEPQEQTREVSIMYQIYDASTKDVLEGHVDRVEDWLDTRREAFGFSDVYSWYSEDDNSVVTRVYLPKGGATEDAFVRLQEQLQAELPVIAGVKLEVGDHRGRHHGPQGGEFVRVALNGEDPEFLEDLAVEVESRFRQLDGAKEVFGPSLRGREEVRIRIDPEAARQLGVSPERIAGTVALVFRGERLRRYQGEQGEIEVVLGLSESLRPGLSALEELDIPSPEGGTVPLGSVASLELSRTPPFVNRVNRKTTVWVTVQVDEDLSTPTAMRESVENVMAGISLPDGYTWDWGQRHHRDDEAMGIMARGVAVSLLVVFLLMAALFESFTQPLAIFITLPLAFFGVFWSLWIFGFTFEILAFIGLIILIGVVVNNGIVMIDHVNTIRNRGVARIPALLEGCGDRFRPVLMTVITTVVGLTPLAMSHFTVAGIYIQSMAVAMIGGLVSSTVFTLIGLPVWYTFVEDAGAVLAGIVSVRPKQTAGRPPRLPVDAPAID